MKMSLVMAAFGGLLAALGGCDDESYAIVIGVSGSASALAAYTVTAGPTQAALMTDYDMAILCTHDRQKFLDAAIPLAVEMNGATVYTATLERYACRLSENPGGAEWTFLYLEDDGTLLHDVTAGDPRVFQTCRQDWSCVGDDL